MPTAPGVAELAEPLPTRALCGLALEIPSTSAAFEHFLDSPLVTGSAFPQDAQLTSTASFLPLPCVDGSVCSSSHDTSAESHDDRLQLTVSSAASSMASVERASFRRTVGLSRSKRRSKRRAVNNDKTAAMQPQSGGSTPHLPHGHEHPLSHPSLHCPTAPHVAQPSSYSPVSWRTTPRPQGMPEPSVAPRLRLMSSASSSHVSSPVCTRDVEQRQAQGIPDENHAEAPTASPLIFQEESKPTSPSNCIKSLCADGMVGRLRRRIQSAHLTTAAVRDKDNEAWA